MEEKRSPQKTEITGQLASIFPRDDGKTYFKFSISGYVGEGRIGLLVDCFTAFRHTLEAITWMR